jgi:hypothetical protein
LRAVFSHSENSMTIVDPLVVTRTTLHEKHPEWFTGPVVAYHYTNGISVDGCAEIEDPFTQHLALGVQRLEQWVDDVHIKSIELNAVGRVEIMFKAILRE